MKIGRMAKVDDIGKWCCGMEFVYRRGLPQTQEIAHRFEIWCFKLVGKPEPGTVINKKKHIVGFWKILWIVKEPDVETRTQILRKKGFRDRQVIINKRRGGYDVRAW